MKKSKKSPDYRRLTPRQVLIGVVGVLALTVGLWLITSSLSLPKFFTPKASPPPTGAGVIVGIEIEPGSYYDPARQRYYDVPVYINTRGKSVTAVDLTVTYPQNLLRSVGFMLNGSSPMNNFWMQNTDVSDPASPETGMNRFIIGSSCSQDACTELTNNTKELLGWLRVVAQSSQTVGRAQMTFTPASQVAAKESAVNVLAKTIPGRIFIGRPSPTPSPTPTVPSCAPGGASCTTNSDCCSNLCLADNTCFSGRR